MARDTPSSYFIFEEGTRGCRMTAKKSEPTLFFDGDSIELRTNILRLVKLGYFVRRCSQHHLRVERVNFWPSTGRIQVDGEISHQKRGWHEFFRVLSELVGSNRAAH